MQGRTDSSLMSPQQCRLLSLLCSGILKYEGATKVVLPSADAPSFYFLEGSSTEFAVDLLYLIHWRPWLSRLQEPSFWEPNSYVDAPILSKELQYKILAPQIRSFSGLQNEPHCKTLVLPSSCLPALQVELHCNASMWPSG